jgi:hypothetical protein
MLVERVRFFDRDTRPRPPGEPEPAEPAQKLARRRRYSHTFSAGRKFRLIRTASGRPKWRRIPDAAIVHYGKVQLNRKGSTYDYK